LSKEFSRKFSNILKINNELPSKFTMNLAQIYENDAMCWPSIDKFSMIIIHPPYLTNTAFSESTQLQLAILGINHKIYGRKNFDVEEVFYMNQMGLKNT